MGVTGLWTVVAPTARPTQLAALNRKRLAVDASIWIYQFLEAVRDKEGNALRNSHVVGFFRRICKLLYFGIKPVFVFDGGAPLLKRETVRGRARRREGRREDAARTAGKLLGMQMQRAAEEEEKRRRAERPRTPEEEELPPEQEMVYVGEAGMSNKERQQNRQFRKKDQYHLPDLDISVESMGAPNDPRIMSQAELEEYARQFHSGEDIKVYDFSKIDFESPFFLSLPASDRYNILNAARLRSRLRMGYSKEQLDDMFPDRMAFSRFQIERVRERNELTQRLMHVNGMAEDFLDQGGRIAGEKGKEYVLVKNEGVEGGWALGVVSNKGRHKAEAIDVDAEVNEESEEEQDEDEEDFEDVAIEGLNRLPKRWGGKEKQINSNPDYMGAAEEIARKRRAVYEARRAAVEPRPLQPGEEALAANCEIFVRQDHHRELDDEADELFEDIDMDQQPDEQDDLQRAIQLSLKKPDDDDTFEVDDPGGHLSTDGNGRNGEVTVEHNNHRAGQTKSGRRPSHSIIEDEESGLDLQTALDESRKSKHQSKSRPGFRLLPTPAQPEKRFTGGPLPFESLNLGQSLLGKKKADKIEEDQAGGFVKETNHRRTKPAPLPSWFVTKDWTKDVMQSNENREHDDDQVSYDPEDVDRRETLMEKETQDVIDLDEASPLNPSEQIVIQSSQDEADTTLPASIQDESVERHGQGLRNDTGNASNRDSVATDDPSRDTCSPGILNQDVADTAQASTRQSNVPTFLSEDPAAVDTNPPPVTDRAEQIDPIETHAEYGERPDQTSQDRHVRRDTTSEAGQTQPSMTDAVEEAEDDFEDDEVPPAPKPPAMLQESRTLKDADIAMKNQYLVADDGEDAESGSSQGPAGVNHVDNQDYLSESDEDLMRQMAIEAEEHARFASSLNHTRTPAEAARDYEKELKQLRNQQKKDRRDADEVTQVMVQECQALLRLFGLPYITAPMEAEAQCAELVSLGLVDGIVTDDSDIFLFGGTRVYKNMFNAAKFVECYLTTDLEKEYALDRRKLIRFAHLLGSDYTEGIPGIGPVTALEILTEFGTLEEFRDWCASIQMGQLDGNTTTPIRKKIRRHAQKMFLPPAFPDTRVDHAYLHPDVDSDPSAFEWGVPDLGSLRAFLMSTIGWSQERTDEILLPVIRDMNKREMEGTQANITRYFDGGIGAGSKEAAAPRNKSLKSGRMEKAFGRLKNVAAEKKKKRVGAVDVDSFNGADQSGDEIDVDDSRADRQGLTRAAKKSCTKKAASISQEDGSPGDGNDSDYSTDSAPRKRRRRVIAA